jgi:hypothetical protein
MTETQSKSGAAGAPTTQADPESADGGAPAAAGRAAVGRATVPGESPSPKFTRAPGMTPPPERPGSGDGARDAEPPQAAGAPAAAAVPAPAPPRPEPPPAGVPAGQRVKPAGAGSTAGHSLAGGAPATTAGAGPPAGATTRGGSAATQQHAPSGGATRAGTLGAATAVGAARVSEAVRAARSTVSGAAARGPRRARLNLKRVDPWSVMKFSFAVSIVLFIVVIVATAVLYLALDAMGVFESINNSLTDLISAGGGSNETTGFKITAKGVIGTAALIGLVNVVLVTALATLSAFIYNVCADLVGGIEVTLAERD